MSRKSIMPAIQVYAVVDGAPELVGVYHEFSDAVHCCRVLRGWGLDPYIAPYRG